MLNEDYKDILQIFIKNHVKFLVVGAYAMGAYGYPRATGDIDLFIERTKKNSDMIYSSLLEFGASLTGVAPETFTEENIIFQIGVAPRRIYIINKIDGVSFSEAYQDKVEIEVENIIIPFISKKLLIKNKLSTGRKKDFLDAEELERI